MQNMIKTYIRDTPKSPPRGVAVLVRTPDDKVLYGFSLCNLNLDQWNKKLGTAIALARATSPRYRLPMVIERESLVLEAFIRLQDRAKKYFKDIDPEEIKLSTHFDTSFEDQSMAWRTGYLNSKQQKN